MLSFILFAINTGNSVFNFSKTTKNLTVIDKKKKLISMFIVMFLLLVDFSLYMCLVFFFVHFGANEHIRKHNLFEFSLC